MASPNDLTVRRSHLGLGCLVLLVAGYAFTGSAAQVPDPMASVWQDLAAKDAGVAYRAIWQLVQHPGPAVKLLRQELKPAAAPDDAKIQQWLTQLASDTFAVREKATRERFQKAILEAVRQQHPDALDGSEP